MRNFGKDDMVNSPLALSIVYKQSQTIRGSENENEDNDAQSGYHRVESGTTSSSLAQRPAWTVLEEFEVDGYSYRVQRRPVDHRGAASLAPREHEAVTLASAGLSRKEIARELGLAPSTVGVLLHRAAQKLHAESRPQLIQNFRASRVNSVDKF